MQGERERDRGYVNYSLIVLFIDCLVFSLCGMALTLDLSFTFLEGMMDQMWRGADDTFLGVAGSGTFWTAALWKMRGYPRGKLT